jgi:TolB-like protein/Tfp pilus assembly protein PilF
MREKVIVGLSLLAFLLALYWLYSDPGPEQGIAAVVLLVGLVSAIRAKPGRVSPATDREGVDAGLSSSTAGLEAPRDHPSLLVIPFKILNPDGGYAYLGDGLTEEIIVDLSRLEGLRVISFQSAKRLKGSEKTAAELAKELGAKVVLEGNLQLDDRAVRVTARLVDSGTGSDIWADRFDQQLTSVLDVQKEISDGIVEALGMKLGASPADTGTGRLPENPVALEAYLRARSEMWDFSPDALQRALTHLETGLEIGGEHEALLATLGQVYANFAQAGVEDSPSYLAKAPEVVERIFRLNPDSAHGHRLAGWVAFLSGRGRDAGPPMKRSWLQDPKDPDTLLMLGYVYCLAGRTKTASKLFQELVEVDPLTPLSRAMPGFVAVMEGRFEDAVPSYRRNLEMHPGAAFAQWGYAWILCYNGHYEKAATVAEQLQKQQPTSPYSTLATSLTLGFKGREEAAAEVASAIATEVSATNELFSRELAHCFAVAGDVDRSLQWLKTDIDIGFINYPFLKEHDRFLDNLRGDERFGVILEAVREEWEQWEL